MLFFLALLLPGLPAGADGFDYSETEEGPDAEEPFSSPSDSSSANDEENEEPARKDTPKNLAPVRFELSDRAQFRDWIQGFCKEEPLSDDPVSRIKVEGARKTLSTAKNKQGSLQLLLENYVSDLDCETNPGTCGETRYNGALDSWKSKTPAGRKDKREAREKILKSEFFRLREVSKLDRETAGKILQRLKEDSSCRTRAVQTRLQK